MSECNKINEEELFKIFKSLHVPIRQNDLKTPTKEFVISVFDTFLRDLQINLANPLLRPFECIQHLENPELVEEGQNYILLAATMTYILRTLCKSPVTITISDIVAPKPKKTKKILNYLVVIWNNVLQKHQLFAEVCNTLEPEIQKAEEINRECHNLDNQYQDCVEKLNSVTAPKDELLKILAAKEETKKKHDSTQKAIIEEYQKLKEKDSHLQTEKANMDLIIATHKETISELDQLILSSPDRVKADVQRLKDMIKDVEEKVLEKEHERKEKKKVIQNKISSQEDVLKSNSKVQKLQSELQSLMETIQNLTMVHEKCGERMKELKELQSAQESKEAMTNFYEEKYAKILQLKERQIEEIMKTSQMLQSQLNEEKQQCDSLSSNIAEFEKNIVSEVDSVVSIVNSCKNAEAETERYKSQYKEIMVAINNQFKDDCEQLSKRAKKTFKDHK